MGRKFWCLFSMGKLSSNSLQALAADFERLNLPDGRNYDFQNPGSRESYIADWRELENSADDLLKNSIRLAAMTNCSKQRAAANKLARHLTKLTEYAKEVLALHDRAGSYLQKSDPSLVEIAWEIFVSKTPRTKWVEKEFKSIQALTKRQNGQYMKLLRERELLQVHLCALTE